MAGFKWKTLLVGVSQSSKCHNCFWKLCCKTCVPQVKTMVAEKSDRGEREGHSNCFVMSGVWYISTSEWVLCMQFTRLNHLFGILTPLYVPNRKKEEKEQKWRKTTNKSINSNNFCFLCTYTVFLTVLLTTNVFSDL